VCIVLLHRHILMLSLEDDEAALLGVPVQAMRLVILLLATLLVASVVSVTGLISFIGLLAPHIARMLLRDNRLPTLLLSGLTGSLLLCCADMLARSVASSELPVSIFTSLLGAPFLIYLLLRRNTT
jgi:iron complex transport system permease protein